MLSRCSGLKSCHIESSSTSFEDLCPETPKYTEIQYRCVNTTTATAGGGQESDRLQLRFRDDKISRVWDPVVVKHVSQTDILLSLNTSRLAAVNTPPVRRPQQERETEPVDPQPPAAVAVDVVVDSKNQSLDQSMAEAAAASQEGSLTEVEEEKGEEEEEKEEEVSEKKVITIAVVVCASLTVLLIVLSLTSSKV